LVGGHSIIVLAHQNERQPLVFSFKVLQCSSAAKVSAMYMITFHRERATATSSQPW